jgi:hypothetical protein
MIYTDTPVCKWHRNQIDLDDGLSLAIFHIPYPYSSNFEQKIDWAVNSFEQIIILCSELHNDSVEFIQKYQHPKIHYFICGSVQDVNAYPWMDWFATTSDFYKNNNLLDQLSPYRVKPKYFDALLGWAKPHRQIAYDYLKDNDDVILSYLTDRSQPLKDSGWISVDGYEISDQTRNTITKVNYHGQQISISQIVPVSVYNQSAYSVVAETNWANHYSFYTEKIVKPILAERLFAVFSGQHYLHNLRSLGFKTFNGIIDESYDAEPDMIRRYAMVYEQIKYLLSQPQDQILNKIRPITEYNKNLMLNKNWISDMHSTIKNIVT